jgi:hypothetical protein
VRRAAELLERAGRIHEALGRCWRATEAGDSDALLQLA